MAQVQQPCFAYHQNDGILSISKFATSTNPQGLDIPTRLKQQQWSPLSKVTGTLGKELPENLKCLMGNNVTFTDIDSAVQHLSHRSYPESFDQNGNKCGQIQIAIPDIYVLDKTGAQFIQIDKKLVEADCQQFGNLLNFGDELGNLGEATAVKQKKNIGNDECIELELPSDEILHQPGPNKLRDMRNALYGDLVEKEFFNKIRQILKDANEEFALFHSHQLFKFNLNDRLNKFAEKDFIIVNYTNRYICGVEVKRSLSEAKILKSGQQLEGSIGKTAKQLQGAKSSLKSWFGSELSNNWNYFSLIHCHQVDLVDPLNNPICSKCLPHVIIGKNEIEPKFNAIIAQIRGKNSDDDDDVRQFTTMVKYLAFAACAAKAPITQTLTRKIDDIVQCAGSAENIQRWMFWTVPQATFFANAMSQQKVLLLGGNGVGKTVVMMQRAKELSIAGEEVVFCIGSHFNLLLNKRSSTKTLLQLQLEAEFDDFHTKDSSSTQQSKKIQVKSLGSYDPSKEYLEKTHVFMDEVRESEFKKNANLRTKSLWVAVSFDHTLNASKDAADVIKHLKSMYPKWYIPFFNFILRTTQNIAKELKKPSRYYYQRKDNNESKLNKLLDVPQNSQEGPEPQTFKDLEPVHFCKKILAIFKETDNALVVINKNTPLVKSMSSKAIGKFKTEFANYYYSDIFKKYPDYGYMLAFLLKSISASSREPTLIWIDDCSFNSNEDQIKDWIRGKSKCNLITDLSVMPGFEASTLVSFVSNDKDTALSRTRVKHILFKVKSSYENIGFKNF